MHLKNKFISDRVALEMVNYKMKNMYLKYIDYAWRTFLDA
jgi:hypothetical protein